MKMFPVTYVFQERLWERVDLFLRLLGDFHKVVDIEKRSGNIYILKLPERDAMVTGDFRLYKDPDKPIGEFMKEVRIKSGFSPWEWAEALGLSTLAVREIESGLRLPTRKERRIILEKLREE